MALFPALGKLKQEDHEFEITLGYIDPVSKKDKENQKNNRVDAAVLSLKSAGYAKKKTQSYMLQS
jgi:hypothetical protein